VLTLVQSLRNFSGESQRQHSVALIHHCFVWEERLQALISAHVPKPALMMLPMRRCRLSRLCPTPQVRRAASL